MDYRFYTLDVFTERRFGGNPLAVVLDADDLTVWQMQAIAREFNLSETVFVQRPTLADALVRVRIFTPTRELPFAGHPTIGTACLLAELGLAPPGHDVRFVLEEAVGLVAVRVQRQPDTATFGQLSTARLPEFGPRAPDRTSLARMLGLQPGQVGVEGESPRMASCGLPFLLVPLAAPEHLAAVDLDTALWRTLLGGAWAQQVYVYAHGYEGELRARMFAPEVGVAEDPATGSAAAALAGALATEAVQRVGTLRWTVQQGQEMGRPSILYTEADKRNGQVTAVRVGGHAVRVSAGEIQVR
jgi:trans-2,3-dihydro-3-hydroxyanthranilate isomerase